MPSRWWESAPEEVFWVEITDRPDLGEDLAAPQLNEYERPYWSYDLVNEVAEGDVVLHYAARPSNRISSWSRAVGQPYEGLLTWGAHGQASGRGPVDPYERPAWRRPLEGPYPIERPATMDVFREAEDEIRRVYDALRERHPGLPLYFPFQLSEHRPVRAFQGYMAKMPRELLLAIPQLAPVVGLAEETRPTAAAPAPLAGRGTFGAPYRRPDENILTRRARDPHSVDPNLVDRGLRAHRRTQNLLHDLLMESGLTPRSPDAGEPEFDLGWEDGEALCIAEVKSLTGTNEEKQIRLALGQVLRYGFLLSAGGRSVRSFIAVERKPQDESWLELTASLGVTLIWPEVFSQAISPS